MIAGPISRADGRGAGSEVRADSGGGPRGIPGAPRPEPQGQEVGRLHDRLRQDVQELRGQTSFF